MMVPSNVTVPSNNAMDRLLKWHLIKSIQCPSCHHVMIFGAYNFGVRVLHENAKDTELEYHMVELTHLDCNFPVPRPLYFCLKCGGKTIQSKTMLIKKYCKCSKDNAVTAGGEGVDKANIDEGGGRCSRK